MLIAPAVLLRLGNGHLESLDLLQIALEFFPSPPATPKPPFHSSLPFTVSLVTVGPEGLKPGDQWAGKL